MIDFLLSYGFLLSLSLSGQLSGKDNIILSFNFESTYTCNAYAHFALALRAYVAHGGMCHTNTQMHI